MVGTRVGRVLAGLFVLAGCTFDNPDYKGDSETESGSESESGSTSESYGTSFTTSHEDTSDTDDLCLPFGGRIIQYQEYLNQDDCESFTAKFRVDTTGPKPTGQLCLLDGCQGCLEFFFELDIPPELFADGECLTFEHRGIWNDDDPEANDNCKTTFLGIFEGEQPIPRYVASSRLFELPDFFPDDYALEILKGDSWECLCGGIECCPDNLATQFEVEFRHKDSLITLVPGDAKFFSIGGDLFYIDVLRAHSRGVFDDDTCTARDFLDWQMFLLP